MKKAQIIRLSAGVGGFAEDKDEAKKIRLQTILPAFLNKSDVVLDFADVNYSTQSFIHALLGEVLRRHGAGALKRLEFKNCKSQVKSIVQLVVDYSLGGFSSPDEKETEPVVQKRARKAHSKHRTKHNEDTEAY